MKTLFVILIFSFVLIGCVQIPPEGKSQEQITNQQILEKSEVSGQVNQAQENEIPKAQEKTKKTR